MGSSKGNTRAGANRPTPRTPQAADAAKKAAKSAAPKPAKPAKTAKPAKAKAVPVPVPEEDDEDILLEEETSQPTTPVENLEKKTAKRTKKPQPTKEEIAKDFDKMIEENEEMIKALQADPDKPKGVIMFLKSKNKELRNLRGKVSRVAKKRVTKPSESTEATPKPLSGFSKPVRISAEMAKFIGWDQHELRSRIEVTKKICEYIRVNNLQDPNDKRIIKPDDKLRKFLKYDASVVHIGKNGEPEKGLYYYRLQTYLRPHYIK